MRNATRAQLTDRDRRWLADLRVMATARAYWRASRRSDGHAQAASLWVALVTLLGGSEWVAGSTVERVRGLDTVRVTLLCGHRYARYLESGKLDARPELIKVGDPVFCAECPRSAVPSAVTRVEVNRREWRHDRISLRCGHWSWRARYADAPAVAEIGHTMRCDDCYGQVRTVIQIWTPAAPVAA